MRIYSWNVNGIRAIQGKGFLEWFRREEPDILCLQETKVQMDQLSQSLLNVEGYHSFWSCAEQKGYSGVAVYSKAKPLAVDYGFGIEKFDSEGRIIVADYGYFTLLNIYFPNGQMSEERLQYKLDFYDATLDYCDKLVSQGKKLVISGDYNTAHREIDLKNPKSNEDRSGFLPIERQWFDKFISHGYIDTYRYLYPEKVEYSWWSYRFKARERNAGWRIDYHFISKNLLDALQDAAILTHVTGSDHCPVTLTLRL